LITYPDDFSFDNYYSNRDRPVITRFFILALLISCLLHFLFLLIFPDWRLWKPVSSDKTSTLQISIQLPVENKIAEPKIEEQSGQEKTSESKAVPQKATEIPSEVVTTSAPVPVVVPKKIKMLTHEELRNIKIESNEEFLPDDNLAFNPRLRKNREITRAMPKGGASKAEGLEVRQDIHGNRFYKSGGQCYKSTTEARGISSTEKGTNWYFTTCDEKSESEKITDRINQDMKQKLRH
jgi:hypothetical protein